MSKYTTEVRFICENACGYSESKGGYSVDSIVADSWNKVFTDKFPIYDESYRGVLCQKILKHFYFREIGCETVGLWKVWMNERLEMIMPYYNQLYKSALLDFNPFYSTDITKSGSNDNQYDEKNSSSSESDYVRTDNLSSVTDSESHSKDTGESRNLYSDTPQGGLSGVENETYLTDARKITDSGSSDDTGKVNVSNTGTQGNKGSDSSNGTKVFSNLSEYTEHIIGKNSSESYSALLNEFRTTFLNIDQMICNELEDLFLQLW